MRRLVDLVVAITAVLLAAPVLVLVALLVLAGLGQPILFRQKRSGLWGQTFTIWKFRTMRASAFAGEHDAQRTPIVGRLLRSTSLDELPQLWNIIRGDMSLIGPRPTLPDQVARYTDHDRRRLSVRPGLTGWAQVNGRNAITWPERIELDIWYIANRTLPIDLTILLRTALRIVRPRGVVGHDGHNPDYPGSTVTSAPDYELLSTTMLLIPQMRSAAEGTNRRPSAGERLNVPPA